MKQKILLFGAQGMLGAEIFNIFSEDSRVEIIPLSRFNCDITQKDAVEESITTFSPDVVINAAAYTNVDKCEDEKWEDIAFAVNALAPDYIASICSQKNIPFYHFSTDYVFSGEKDEIFLESSVPNPINAYGVMKYEGEKNALQYPQTKICRVSWLSGDCGPNFVHKIVHFSKTRPTVSIVEEYGTPCFVTPVAQQLLELIFTETEEKIFHLVSEGSASRMELVQEIQKFLDIPTERNLVLSEYFDLLARRPLSSILHNTLLPPQKSWQENLHDFLSLEKEKLDKKRLVQAKKDAAKSKYQAIRAKEREDESL